MKTLRQTERILRILYPVWALVGMFSLMYVPSQVVVPGDAAATAAQIASQELLFRAGVVGSLATQILFLFGVFDLPFGVLPQTDRRSRLDRRRWLYPGVLDRYPFTGPKDPPHRLRNDDLRGNRLVAVADYSGG